MNWIERELHADERLGKMAPQIWRALLLEIENTLSSYRLLLPSSTVKVYSVERKSDHRFEVSFEINEQSRLGYAHLFINANLIGPSFSIECSWYGCGERYGKDGRFHIGFNASDEVSLFHCGEECSLDRASEILLRQCLFSHRVSPDGLIGDLTPASKGGVVHELREQFLGHE
jgi:hypothetical protein